MQYRVPHIVVVSVAVVYVTSKLWQQSFTYVQSVRELRSTNSKCLVSSGAAGF